MRVGEDTDILVPSFEFRRNGKEGGGCVVGMSNADCLATSYTLFFS